MVWNVCDRLRRSAIGVYQTSRFTETLLWCNLMFMASRTATSTRAITRLCLLVLMIGLGLLHTFTIADRAGAFSSSVEMTHALLHWQGEAHHHHEDGSLAKDHSAQSTQHLNLDGCTSAVAILPPVLEVVAPILAASQPRCAIEQACPWRTLDAPLRPPRSVA